MRSNIYTTVWFILIFNYSASAQFEVYPATAIPVHHANGSAMPNPWTGGLNAAQISMFDADGDGIDDDLFVFDRSGHRILVFTGQMVNGERQYHFEPKYSRQFPDLKHWALLRDFNCDGLVDIFTYSPLGGGFATHENVTQAGGDLAFSSENELILSRFQFNPNTFFNANIYVSALDIPAITDADGDGDLDIFTFSVSGTQMEYHENLSMDETGNCGTQNYRAANMCYGQFREGSESNEVFLGLPCSFQVINPKSGDGNLRHVGTTILAHDMNGDEVIDLVLGGVSFNNLTFLNNSVGSNGIDSIVDYQPDFPAEFGSAAVDIDNFISSFYEDVTGDGVKDLIATVNEAFIARNTRSIWLYENLGTNNNPIFSLTKLDFLQETTIDHGEVAAPAFADVNGDGLPDMVIGSRGEFLQGTAFKPALSLYLNTGTATEPRFQLENANWLQASDIGFGQYVHPSFGDIDGDGDKDLVIGDLSGRVFLLLNTAGAGQPMSFELAGALTAGGAVINVGQSSTPQLYDLNQDGKMDLVIGERNGNLNYYQNTGSTGNFSFTFITDTLGGISTVEPGYFIGNSAPHFFEYEGSTHLIIGVERGRIHHYSGIDDNIDGSYTQESLNAFGIEAGEKSRPVVIDIDNDGQPDIFCGSIGGGLLLFSGNQSLSTVRSTSTNKTHLTVYPNPAVNELHVRLPGMIKDASYEVYALSGKRVMAGQLKYEIILVNHLATGAYILKVTSEDYAERALWMKY